MPEARPSKQDRDCPACGRLTTHSFQYRKNGCEIWRCETCGLGRADTASFDPQAFYTGDYFTGGRQDGYADYPASEPVLRQEFARTVNFMREHQASGRLLDIGCAYGFFLLEARQHFEAAGIELAEDAAAHGRSRGLQVISGEANPATLSSLGPMDVITLLDVIEHLPAPRETIALCQQHLRPGGIMVITTGDFASPVARLMGSGWRLMTPPQHLWYFTPESMHRLAAGVGLTVERLDHPAKIVPLGLIFFQLQRMLGSSLSSKSASTIGIPVNLFDAMRVVLRKPPA